MIKSKIGIEAEYILIDVDNVPRIIPDYWDHDAFPLLGEIRGEPGTTWTETMANFEKARYELLGNLETLPKSKLVFVDRIRVPLKRYKEANKQMDWNEKASSLGKVQNINDINIEDFSDQVISKGKILGVDISCGLHIHFSCDEVNHTFVKEAAYESVTIPAAIVVGTGVEQSLQLNLHRRVEGTVTEKLEARASRITKPVINHIVSAMDKEFFGSLVPKGRGTKYRQPGFYELKPYGFEYRSLPANSDSLGALPDIIKKAFALLREVNS